MVRARSMNAQAVLTVVVSDSSRGGPVDGASLDIVGPMTFNARTDERGRARVSLAAGTYRLQLRRLGYRMRDTAVRVDSLPFIVSLRMAAEPRALERVKVFGGGPGVFGVVASIKSLRPIGGAHVEVAGSGQSAETDSTGEFFVPLRHGGSFVVRMTRPGFQDELFTIEVPSKGIADASRFLSEGSSAPLLPGPWQEFDKRLRLRGRNSALVPGAVLRERGGLLADALQSAPEMVTRGLRLSGPICLFIDGIPRPGLGLNALRLEEIQAVEVYGSRGDPTSSLRDAWPPGAPCVASGLSPAAPLRQKQFVSVWTVRR
jgi:hypothetical protein